MGYVYLICNAADDLYKVGVTKGSVEKRLKQLQTGSGRELHLIESHKTDHPFYIEKMLHMEYSNNNTINEWFELSNQQVFAFKDLCKKYEDVIVAMESNTFFNKKELK